MTIKNEKYLPRLKKNCQKKRKIQTEKNTSHKKKIMETLKSTSVVGRSKWLSKKEKKSNYEKNEW